VRKQRYLQKTKLPRENKATGRKQSYLEKIKVMRVEMTMVRYMRLLKMPSPMAMLAKMSENSEIWLPRRNEHHILATP